TLQTVSVFLGRGDGAFRHLGDHAVPGAPRSVEALDLEGDGRADLVVGLSLSGVLPLRGKGDGRFETGALDPTFADAECIAAADLDRDGLQDLVAYCGKNGGSVGINLGDGTFVWSHAFPEAGAVAVGDLDGDGELDLAAVSGAIGGELLVHPGTGDGSFLNPISFGSIDAVPNFLLAADLDGDGRQDLIATGPSITVFWGRPAERFLTTAARVSGFHSPGKDLAVADLDRDGAPDLLIARGSEPGIDVYLQPGRSSPAQPSFTIATDGAYSSLEALDLDGDGVPDIVGVDPRLGVARAALLDGAGVIREVAFPAGAVPQRIKAGSLDGDGRPDLAVASSGPNQLVVFLGQGGGAFGQGRAAAVGEIPRDLALGDLDRDGLGDLAVIEHSDRIGAPFI
ncbi:MAG: FG-GAP repeat domain-containing protein, partial [Thermoanaerobaculia bacterium]